MTDNGLDQRSAQSSPATGPDTGRSGWVLPSLGGAVVIVVLLAVVILLLTTGEENATKSNSDKPTTGSPSNEIAPASGNLADAIGGGAPLWSDDFTVRPDGDLIGTSAALGGVYAQHGQFNAQNHAPRLVGGRYVIDPYASQAGWAFILMQEIPPVEAVGAECGYTPSASDTPVSTQECVLIASHQNPTLSSQSVQFATSPVGGHIFKIFGGKRVPVGAVGYLSASLDPNGGPITSIPVTAGFWNGVTHGITQDVPAGEFTLVSNDGEFSQSWETTGAEAGDTAIPVTSQTPNFAYSSVAPVAAVVVGDPAPSVIPWAKPLAEDDVSRYQPVMRMLDRETSTIACTVNGVTVGTWTDPDFADLWPEDEPQLGVQLLRGTNTGNVWVTAVEAVGAPAG
jgi:hypothetical protein